MKEEDTPEETEETKTYSPGRSATKKVINAKTPQRPISNAVRMKNNEHQWHRVWHRVGPQQWVGLARLLVFLSLMLLFSRSVVSNSVTPGTDCCSLPGSSVHGIP